MVQQFNITRENIVKQVWIGITDNKESELYLQDVEPDSEFSVYNRWSFDSLFVDTDKESLTGKVNLIKTTWRKNKVSINGVPMPGYQVMEVMITNPEDIKTFMEMFGVPILSAMINGFGRDIMGHNHLPIIDTRTKIDGVPNANFGKPMIYTAYLESIPPTKDYNTWLKGHPLPEILTEPIEPVE